MKTFPPFLAEMLAASPHAGEGVHNWLFCVSRQLHAHLPALEIITLLEERTRACGRHVSRKEIEDAVRNSLPSAWEPNGKTGGTLHIGEPAPAKWPEVNKELREAVIAENGGLADLWECGNPRFEDSENHTEQIIDWLFPGNPLLCCGKSSHEFDTRPRDEWRGDLSALQLIVPSPMSAVEGVTKEGKPSRHTLSNTGPRRYLICEFDTGAPDDHAALLLHLRTFAPLVCVVHSGGKSLHGWFLVEGQPPDKVEKFFRYAVSLGADRATWTLSQFVRMPDGTRDDGRGQVTYFLNLTPLQYLATSTQMQPAQAA
ncbi:MAG: hypothetical protein EXS29_04950 [Pedosphaera sp.]|nr:hypothetical protein [Pedosphaera sp.]